MTFFGFRFRMISIHPPARGGTVARQLFPPVVTHFNPPTRKGWDRDGVESNIINSADFNPPTRKGWDWSGGSVAAEDGQISIHPPARGGTFLFDIFIPLRLAFQSTHPQGVGLFVYFATMQACQISIHPPARGGTLCTVD